MMTDANMAVTPGQSLLVGPGQVYRLTGTPFTPTPVRQLTLNSLDARAVVFIAVNLASV